MNEPTPEELKEFSERMRASLGPDALRALVALGREHLAPVHPDDGARSKRSGAPASETTKGREIIPALLATQPRSAR